MNQATRTYQNQSPKIGKHVYIDRTAVVIGNVYIGNNVSIWPMAVVRADVNSIHIGENSNIQDAAILHVTHDGPYTPGGKPLIIEQGVTVGHQAVLHACHIRNYCLIGIGSIILDGAILEEHVMVAAGSLVPPNKRLKSGYLYLGNPARAVRRLKDAEIEHLEYSAAHYQRLKNNYL